MHSVCVWLEKQNKLLYIFCQIECQIEQRFIDSLLPYDYHFRMGLQNDIKEVEDIET